MVENHPLVGRAAYAPTPCVTTQTAGVRELLRRRLLDDRLRAVEVAFGKVDQRLETLERTILPAPADD